VRVRESGWKERKEEELYKRKNVELSDVLKIERSESNREKKRTK
jgi:hypothetical protein